MTNDELREMIQQAKDLMVKGDCFDTESRREDRHAWFVEAYELLGGVQYHLKTEQ